MLLASNWKDYELKDASNGEKLERYGKYVLLRPDPSIIWDNGNLKEKYRGKINAIYHRSNKGGGYWENLTKVPETWTINYRDLTFNVKQMGFKHTGIFPEQAVNWDFMMTKIKNAKREIKVLNLFGYTGCASVSCLKSGAHLTHVDASKGMINVCKENVKSSDLSDKPIRYIVDDVVKFVKREIRRGHKYDAIIMDPPSYGRGANKEIWEIEKDLAPLINLCVDILSDNPLFFIINCYTTSLSNIILNNVLTTTVSKKYHGKVTSGELGIPIKNNNFVLPCGIYGRWENDD